MRKGDVLGHEFMGVVDAVGPAVTKFKKGDRAVASFEMGCGQCYFCKHDQFSSCDTTNPRLIPLGLLPSARAHTASYRGSCAYLRVCCSEAMEKLYGDRTGGFHGYSHLTGGFEGGQAEYARVPFGGILICILWSHDA